MQTSNNSLKHTDMLKYITIAVGCLIGGSTAQAQSTCIIKGKIVNDEPQHITKVYLTQIDELHRFTNIDSAKVKKGTFQFKRKLSEGTPSLLYQITGFDNGAVDFFVESGTVNIQIDKAASPTEADAYGTPTNDLYKQYKQIKRCISNVNQSSPTDVINSTADRINFLLDHNDSPLSPLMMETEVYQLLDKNYAQKLFDALSPKLKTHPYYRSYGNIVKALDIQKGSELPDITLPLPDGTIKHLSDFRGKYVLLDFWASWCSSCLREMPYVTRLFEETQKDNNKFTIVSFSLDNNYDSWQKAITSLDMDKENWIHASDLMRGSSPAVRLMNVTDIPYAILIDPEGRAIAFNLKGEDMIRRVKRILGGDLYYQNEK